MEEETVISILGTIWLILFLGGLAGSWYTKDRIEKKISMLVALTAAIILIIFFVAYVRSQNYNTKKLS